MVRWKTEKPFSANPADWAGQARHRHVSKPGEGVLDAAISPDGKQMAVVHLGANGRPELFLAKPDDFLLQPTRSRSACAPAR